jgi:hypothetical protein
MTVLWVVTGAALALAVVAWLTARRAAKRLTELSEMYWELKYQQGELKNAVLKGSAQADPAAQPSVRPPDGFVPLKALRDRDSFR